MELITMEELKKKKIWQCFALEGQGEHKSKPPVSPVTGARSNGREGATTYEEAVEYFNHPFGLYANGVSGVGLLLVDGITLVDLDNILSEDGALSPDTPPEMEAFLESLPPDTYVEISPSGRGLHILGIDVDNEVTKIARVRPYGKDIGLQKMTIRNGKENVSYSTITGKRWRDFQVSSLSDISEILRTLKSLYFEEEEAPLLRAEEEEEEPEYPEEIRRLLRGGNYSKRWRDNFSRLWRGEPASSGESDSSATGVDYSLCLYLSELVSREEREEAAGCSKVERLFEESPNFAKKDNNHLKRWSGSKELTISKAWHKVMEKKESAKMEEEDTKAVAASLLASADFASGFAEFMHMCFEEPEEGLSTGITGLDSILDGGIYPGIYVLGGTPGAGKTTFLLHLAENIIKRNTGRSVLFFGLETSKAEVYGKLLSGHLFLDYGARFTYRDIKSRLNQRSMEEKELVKMEYNSIVRDLKERLFLFPPRVGGYSVKLISDTTGLFMERYEKPPLVIVDYLQILKAEGNSDKERIDSSLSALSELSKSLSLPLLLTTSLNRASYSGDKKTTPTRLRNSAMKESGGIEYTCDCSIFLEKQVIQKQDGGEKATFREREDRADFWGAKFRGMEVNEMDSKRPEYQTLTRYLRLTVNKDRNGGQGAAPLRYAPKYNAFEEDKTEVRYVSSIDDYITEDYPGGTIKPFWSGDLDKV